MHCPLEPKRITVNIRSIYSLRQVSLSHAGILLNMVLEIGRYRYNVVFGTITYLSVVFLSFFNGQPVICFIAIAERYFIREIYIESCVFFLFFFIYLLTYLFITFIDGNCRKKFFIVSTSDSPLEVVFYILMKKVNISKMQWEATFFSKLPYMFWYFSRSVLSSLKSRGLATKFRQVGT